MKDLGKVLYDLKEEVIAIKFAIVRIGEQKENIKEIGIERINFNSIVNQVSEEKRDLLFNIIDTWLDNAKEELTTKLATFTPLEIAKIVEREMKDYNQSIPKL
jgi:hypothetical protein